MAMNYSDYPENWKDIRTGVLERAKNADGISQCECVGECGREHKGTRCPHLRSGFLTTRSKYKVILTTAHLCHDTRCARLDHLKSMCQPCHQIFDLRERQKAQAVGGNIKLGRRTMLANEGRKPRLQAKRITVRAQVETDVTGDSIGRMSAGGSEGMPTRPAENRSEMVKRDEVKMKNEKKNHRGLSEEDKQEIRKRIDQGERNSSKLAEEFGARTQQIAGIMARHLHPESWG